MSKGIVTPVALITVLLFVTNIGVASVPASASGDSTWSALASTPEPVGPGASLATAPGIVGAPFDYIFATRGGGTTDFWRYDITANSWAQMASTPGPVGDGGSLVEAYGCSGFVIYALQGGGQSGNWEYDISSNTWTVLSNTPAAVGAGGGIAQLQTIGALVALAGGGTTHFWVSHTCGPGWQALPDAPGPVGAGGGLVGLNYGNLAEYVVAQQGDGQSGYWLFNYAADAWSVLPDVPAAVGGGGGTSTDNYDNGALISLIGGGSNRAFCFSNIFDGNWVPYSNFPVSVGPGGAEAIQLGTGDQRGPAPSGNTIFAFAGSGMTSFYESYITPSIGSTGECAASGPPSSSVSITSPETGSAVSSGYGLSVSATPSSGKIVGRGSVVARAAFTPQSSLSTNVMVSYSNQGGAASGTLTLTDNGDVVGSLPLADFQGSASTTFTVSLGDGQHTLVATLSLSNAQGTSAASSNSDATVSPSTISLISSLSFPVAGAASVSYSGKLTYQIVASDGTIVAQGNLGNSAESFSLVALPTPVSGGESLILQEPIKVSVTGGGLVTVSVAATVNGQSSFATEKSTLLSGLNRPENVAVDSAGDIYFTQGGGDNILVHTETLWRLAPGASTPALVFTLSDSTRYVYVSVSSSPFDSDGNLYFVTTTFDDTVSPITQTDTFYELNGVTGQVTALAALSSQWNSVEVLNNNGGIPYPPYLTGGEAFFSSYFVTPSGNVYFGDLIFDSSLNEQKAQVSELPDGGAPIVLASFPSQQLSAGATDTAALVVDGNGNVFVRVNDRALTRPFKDFSATIQKIPVGGLPRVIFSEMAPACGCRVDGLSLDGSSNLYFAMANWVKDPSGAIVSTTITINRYDASSLFGPSPTPAVVLQISLPGQDSLGGFQVTPDGQPLFQAVLYPDFTMGMLFQGSNLLITESQTLDGYGYVTFAMGPRGLISASYPEGTLTSIGFATVSGGA